ncbi:hypothetical protein BH11PAT2_BH11PAT2_06080 [soil metagenome]
MSFNGPPKPLSQPQSAEKRNVPSFNQMMSSDSVHGLGYEPLTENERSDVSALLSTAGSSMDDPILQNLFGEDLMNLREYAQARPGSPERAAKAQLVKTAIERVRTGYYKQAA